MRSLLSIRAKNFLSLSDVDVELQELSVLVGPNGAGKSNLLKVIQFLGDTARYDLGPAINMHGGYDRLFFRGQQANPKPRIRPRIELGITGQVTANASANAPDEYMLKFWQQVLASDAVTQRREEFAFKRTAGRGRRITVEGNRVEIRKLLAPSKSSTPGGPKDTKEDAAQMSLSLISTSSALSTLPRLGRANGGEQINQLAELFTTFRVFEVDVARARAPSKYDQSVAPTLASDASNLAGFLQWLRTEHDEVFQQYVEDLRAIVPSIQSLRFVKLSGADDSGLLVQLKEHGLSDFTDLGEASFGTIRTMALLAMLHDPHPPRLTCVEEIDHGLHPHALDRIVERMRSASERTQLLVVTHSPALANRLQPKEIVVCERNYKVGASLIPAISSAKVQKMAQASGLLPGELWFSGALGGGLE
jgi:predicted ATPase